MEKPGTRRKKIARWYLSGFDQDGFEAALAGFSRVGEWESSRSLSRWGLRTSRGSRIPPCGRRPPPVGDPKHPHPGGRARQVKNTNPWILIKSQENHPHSERLSSCFSMSFPRRQEDRLKALLRRRQDDAAPFFLNLTRMPGGRGKTAGITTEVRTFRDPLRGSFLRSLPGSYQG
jgi:hypothetical protein